MRCPYCEAIEDKVIESRMLANGESIRRRRECLKCGYRFTSYEHIEEKKLMVVKRDGRRQDFDLKKLGHGIQRAIEKRPIPQTVVEEMLMEIEDEAFMKAKNTHEIPSTELGEMVLKRLYKLDRVAYIRFASVYRKFENVKEFISEIEKLSKKK
jgi:transcriptional repressor NrdR